MAHTVPFSHQGAHHDLSAIKVNSISLQNVNHWLSAGISDYKRTFVASTVYGVIFALFYDVLLTFFNDTPLFVLGMSSGFLLLAPFLAVGLYELSLRLERGEATSFMHSATAWKRNFVSISVMALLLGVLMAFWIQTSALIVGLFFNSVTLGEGAFLMHLITAENSAGFLLAYLGIGFVFALIAFGVSAVSFPMLLDHNDEDFVSAAITSLKSVLKNPVPMLYWAAVIVVSTVVGFATFGIGLIFLIPILGHASWHAYKDLVAHKEV